MSITATCATCGGHVEGQRTAPWIVKGQHISNRADAIGCPPAVTMVIRTDEQ